MTLYDSLYSFVSSLPVLLSLDHGREEKNQHLTFPNSRAYFEWARERKDLHNYRVAAPCMVRSELYGGAVTLIAWKDDIVETGS